MDDETAAKVARFYREQTQYEKKLRTKRAAIVRDRTLSDDEKQRRLSSIVMKCPGCKKPGGMVFSREGTRLVATCGAETPCEDTLSVDRGYYSSVRDEAEDLPEAVRGLENEVIRAKLDLLFGYATQGETVSRFEKLRPGLREVSDRLEQVRTEYWRVVTRAGTKADLHSAQAQLAVARDALGDLSDGVESEARDAKRAAAMYADTIEPLAERIRKLKYAQSAVIDVPPVPPAGADAVAGVMNRTTCGTSGERALLLAPYTLEQLLVSTTPPGPPSQQ